MPTATQPDPAATDPTKPIVFVVPGEPLASAADEAEALSRGAARDAAPGRLRGVRIGAAGATRGEAAHMHRLEASQDQDIVVITVGTPDGEGPELRLRLHPDHARALFQAQAGGSAPASAARGARSGPDADANTVRVPATAQWQGFEAASGTSRGLGSDLFFKTLQLVGLDPRDALARLAAGELGRRLDGQVNEGVYAVQRQTLGSLKNATPVSAIPGAGSAPMLVLLHGTFVNTASSFGKLWSHHGALVAQLFDFYQDRVYALDHGTVMRSPIDNALTLARSLPPGARLHLVTHSRGGLVAEVLARAALGVGKDDAAFFDGPSYKQHRARLLELGQMLQDKKVVVERVVRVACPAYGTLLASNRLDAYLSVLAWLMERVGLPVLPELVRFADAVAHERTDPASLPGIEAMRSDSALIRWLNSAGGDGAPGALRVVAGDISGDSLVSWVKTLLSDSYFWTDNDLVVQTSAMYGGMLRANEASFMLDRGGKTDHFSYFENDRTANGIAQALIETHPEGFAPIGQLSRQGKSASGMRGGAPGASLLPDPLRPAVLVLPGILGSNLKRGEQREWFVWWRLPGLIDRIALPGAGASTNAPDPVSQDGPVGSYYDDLMEHLRASHDVIPFGFDWRLSLSESAALLAGALRAALDARKASGQPVRLLAHSMGSVLLRVMQLEHPQVWQDMMQRDGARVLMLGPPHGGSWAPMTIYTGDDQMGRFLSTVGGGFREEAARRQMVRFTGLLQLQAGLTDPAQGLDKAAHWQEMADRDLAAARASQTWHNTETQAAPYRWAVPSQDDLNQAVALRRRLDAQLPQLQADATRMAIVLGQAPDTPCGVTWTDSGMQYLSTREGDGRVTWESARLPGVPTWITARAHGDLPKVEANFTAYTELLQRGDTAALKRFGDATRGEAAADALPAAPATPMQRLRDSRIDTGGAPVSEDDLLAAAMGSLPAAPDPAHARAARRAGPTLLVEVVHGDLTFIREPMLVGHSRSLELTGSEYVLDRLLGGALREALELGLYPDALGTHQTFINRHRDAGNPYAFPRPTAAIVIGLGDESGLQPNALGDAVRQGVLGYQRRMASGAPAQGGLTLAATSLGSGGNLSVNQSVLALVRGVVDANARLANARQAVDWPPVAHLRIVELFGNRALEAWYAVQVAVLAGLLDVRLQPQVSVRNGARSQPAGGNYRSAGYELVRISRRPLDAGARVDKSPGRKSDPSADRSTSQPSSQAEIEFSLYTRRARSEVRGKGTQVALLERMVAVAERSARYDADLARSLYQLLVPHELKTYLSGADTLVLEVDADTAAFPWEMLDDGGAGLDGSGMPLTLRLSGTVLRKMRVESFRRAPADAPTEDVLVIGPPRLDKASGMPELPGARVEAQAVAAIFGTEAQLDAEFLSIVKLAIPRPWKVMHIAGHGTYDARGGRSGLMMSDGMVFGPAEFESMPTVPELVFVNCCHLGKTEMPEPRHRGLLAANVAEQLIRNGVRCVVAAGWAVDDDAAKAFACAFYAALTQGERFGDAVRRARLAAYKANPRCNTWAAYQCYGDPGWTLRRAGAASGQTVRKNQTPAMATADELLLDLEAIRCDAPSADARRLEQLVQRLVQLEALAVPAWLASGRVAEGFGLTWRAIGDQPKAIAWLDAAVRATDGSASLLAREQQLNLSVRSAALVQDTGTRIAQLEALVVQIEALIALAPTSERYALLGSAYKRMAMAVTAAGVLHDDAVEAAAVATYEALARMGDAYLRAEAFDPPNLFYPLSQRCLAELRMHWMTPGLPAPGLDDVRQLRQSIARQDAQDPDFWSVVGMIEANLLEGLIRHDLAQRIAGIEADLTDVHARVTSKRHWSSVSDTAQFLLGAYVESGGGAGPAADQRAAARTYLDLVLSFAQ